MTTLSLLVILAAMLKEVMEFGIWEVTQVPQQQTILEQEEQVHGMEEAQVLDQAARINTLTVVS